MECPKCGNPIKSGQRFCTKCGQSIPANPKESTVLTCSQCGASLKPGQKFCTKCGLPVTNPSQEKTAEKGFSDIITHPITFIHQGSRGVNRQVRREEEVRLQQRAQAMGLELSRPTRSGEQPIQSNGQFSYGESLDQREARQLVVDNTSVEGISIVNGRAIWDIQKGEIGRVISESEFSHANGLKGIIVQEGCTAMVFIDGQFITMMTAGVYTFPYKTDTERALEQRQRDLDEANKMLEKQCKELEEAQQQKDQAYARSFASRGVFGEIAAFGRGVMNFLFGKKKEENPQKHQERVERLSQKLRSIPSPKICRVYIVSNRVISLLFKTQVTDDGTMAFAPIVVPTKLFNINVGVSMQLEVDNMQEFVKNYLADRTTITSFDIQQLLTPAVQSQLTQFLRNLDYQQEGLSEVVVTNLKSKLVNCCNEQLFGIKVQKVLNITDNSADFERFRIVERELFSSEKELAFLHRTGEFRNRLEIEENKQALDRANNKEELRRALRKINAESDKHDLINDDELEQFVLLTESQKRIRNANLQKDEAAAMEEIRAALLELKKCKLVKDDELAALEATLLRGKLERDDSAEALKNELELRRLGRDDEIDIKQNEINQRRIDRENISQIMRIQATQKEALARQTAEFEISDKQIAHDMANALRQAQHQGILAAAQLDTKRLLDTYNDERKRFEFDQALSMREKEADYSFKQAERQDDYEFNKAQRQQRAEWERTERETQLRHEEEDRKRTWEREDKLDDMDLLERKAAISQKNLQEMQDRQFRELQELNRFAESQQKEANRSAENMRSLEVQEKKHRATMEQQMSAEQLREVHREKLSEAAQIESFKTESVKEQAEFYRLREEEARRLQQEERERTVLRERDAHEQRNEDMERLERIQRSSNADIKEMLREMMETVRDVSANNAQVLSGQFRQQIGHQQEMNNLRDNHMRERYNDQVARANEYRADAYHQQSRMDHTQDQALNMTGAIATSVARNVGSHRDEVSIQQVNFQDATAQPTGQRICPSCGATVPDGELFCGECGQRL